MSRKFLNLAHRAASHPGCVLLVHSTLDILSKQIEEEIASCTNNVEAATVPMNMTPSSDLVSTACLKKKDVQTKSSKRKRGWMDKKRKFAKKGSKKNDKGSVVCISTKKHYLCLIVKNVQLCVIFILFY
jgi:hypothetical protein